MGWSHCGSWRKPSDVRAYLIERTEAIGHKVVEHATTGYGRRWWAVIEDRTGERFIVLALFRPSRYGWGYKDLEETCGPVEVDCPLRYLDLAPDPGGFATSWRAEVRRYHETRKARPRWKVGDVCRIGRHAYTIVSRDRTRRYWRVRDGLGTVWLARAGMMKAPEDLTV